MMDFVFDPSLVLYLPLYELDGSPFMSKDAYGHLCTVTGALWTPQGRSFDGADDLIDCGNKSCLAVTNKTIELWALREDDSGDWERMLSKSDDSSQDFWVQIKNTDEIRAEYVATDLTTKTLDTTWKMPINEWHHLLITFDGTYQRIYIDGELEATSADWSAFIPRTSTRPIRIGVLQTWYKFDGLIGEVRMYSRTLTPLEIQHNYLATKWRYR